MLLKTPTSAICLLLFASVTIDHAGAESNEVPCDETVDCVPLTPPWANDDYEMEEFLMLPSTREEINTKFLLLTKKNSVTPMNIDQDTLGKSPFNASNPSIFIIHGFLDWGTHSWLIVCCLSCELWNFISFVIKI